MSRKRIIAARILLPLVLIGIAAVIACRYTPLGNSLLWSAASSGNATATRLLILLGADVNARDSDQGTPLFAAAGHAHPEVIRILLQAGAEPLTVDSRGETALCYSILSDSPKSLQCDTLLIAAGCLQRQGNPLFCTWSSLTAAAHVKILLEHGVDPHVLNDEPLRLFADNGNVKALAVLLEYGARINAAAPDGSTALSQAVVQGSPEAVEFLVNHGADTTVQLQGRSLLDKARAQRQEYRRAPAAVQYDAIIRFLQEYSAKNPAHRVEK